MDELDDEDGYPYDGYVYDPYSYFYFGKKYKVNKYDGLEEDSFGNVNSMVITVDEAVLSMVDIFESGKIDRKLNEYMDMMNRMLLVNDIKKYANLIHNGVDGNSVSEVISNLERRIDDGYMNRRLKECYENWMERFQEYCGDKKNKKIENPKINKKITYNKGKQIRFYGDKRGNNKINAASIEYRLYEHFVKEKLNGIIGVKKRGGTKFCAKRMKEFYIDERIIYVKLYLLLLLINDKSSFLENIQERIFEISPCIDESGIKAFYNKYMIQNDSDYQMLYHELSTNGEVSDLKSAKLYLKRNINKVVNIKKYDVVGIVLLVFKKEKLTYKEKKDFCEELWK